MRKSNCLIILLVILIIGVTPASHALNPQGRHLSGTIQQADAKTCRAVLFISDQAKPVAFIWNKHTDFVAGKEFVPASRLARGASVEIILHRPFFGEPFVTKVIFLGSTTKS